MKVVQNEWGYFMAIKAKKMRDKAIPRLLIVDDEPQIREVIANLLSDSFRTILASNGAEAIALAKSENPALILLDIVMPGESGITVCEVLRSHPSTKHIPVIMLSAAGNLENRKLSFNNGADDFIAKPFDADELIARVKSKLRRAGELRANHKSLLVSRNLVLDLSKVVTTIDGEKLQLSNIEFSLLGLLLKKIGHVVSRREIIATIWKDAEVSERLIDAHVVALRKKIAKYEGEVATIYGKGYALRSLNVE